MSPITIVEEALTEGRALFSAAGELRDLFKGGRAQVDALNAEAKGVVDGVLSSLRAGLDEFKAQASKIEADAAPEPAGEAPPRPAGDGTPHPAV